MAGSPWLMRAALLLLLWARSAAMHSQLRAPVHRRESAEALARRLYKPGRGPPAIPVPVVLAQRHWTPEHFKKGAMALLHPPVPSPGCSKNAAPSAGHNSEDGFHMHVHVPWEEPGLPAINRSYGMYVPGSYDPSKPTPLLLVFHGWGEDGAEYHRDYDFGRLAKREGFVVIYPIGMDDCSTDDCYKFPSWNGAGTSSSSNAKMSCDLSVQKYNYCYDSCKAKRGSCHPCDWTTCYDDVGFIKKLLHSVQDKLCVDRTRIFAHGCSNGAMFVHELAQKLPGVFAGAVASCGGKPHLGWENSMPTGGPPISMATIVGNMDDTIPRNGSLEDLPWWDGYRFASEQKVMEVYKDYNNCSNAERRRYGAGLHAKNMTCWEEGYDCAGHASVARCTFSGIHGFNEGTGKNGVMDDLEFAWEFLSDHPLPPEFLAA
mmetsp:Transcript_93910/g.249322  ORF Transcript_93910/g.249322 Transcript_93910/m.249322 type:complete len:430 (-) Transcript_93910:77-1366(-)